MRGDITVISEARTGAVDDAVTLARLRELVASGRAREIRERARLSQAEVGAAVGVHQPTVHKWETGRTMPRGQAAVAYVGLLDKLSQVVPGQHGGAAREDG
jgi:DNA-binding transcriptional regulator YiaG